MTETTDSLVKRWSNAKQRLDRAKQELNSADCELSNATNALGKHLTPKDSKPGEQFGVWINAECVGIPGDRMIQIIPRGNNSYELDWRK